MVAYLLSELLEVGTTHRQSAARTLDSTNFPVVPSWKASDGSTTFSLGVEAWILLQVQRLGAMDWGRNESRRLGSTLQIFHRILLYIEQPDFVQDTMWSRCILRLRPKRACQIVACTPDLTWPDLALDLNLPNVMRFVYTELGLRVKIANWTAYLHMEIHDSALLQAQAN